MQARVPGQCRVTRDYPAQARGCQEGNRKTWLVTGGDASIDSPGARGTQLASLCPAPELGQHRVQGHTAGFPMPGTPNSDSPRARAHSWPPCARHPELSLLLWLLGASAYLWHLGGEQSPRLPLSLCGASCHSQQQPRKPPAGTELLQMVCGHEAPELERLERLFPGNDRWRSSWPRQCLVWERYQKDTK